MGKNDIHYKVWDGITYPFPNFNGGMRFRGGILKS